MAGVSTTLGAVLKGRLRMLRTTAVNGIAPELATGTLILTEGLHPNKTFKGQRVAN